MIVRGRRRRVREPWAARRRVASLGALMALASAGPAPAVAVSAGPAPRADAAPPGGVAVEPVPGSRHLARSRHALDFGSLRAGSSAHDEVVVRTLSQQPVAIDVYPADGEQSVGGGIGFTLRDQPQQAFGRWARVSPGRVTVSKDHPARVTLSIDVPAAAAGGRHVGGVVAEPPAPPSSSGGIDTVYRYGMAVYLDVKAQPAPQHSGASPPASGGPARIVPVRVDIARRGGSACVTATYRNDGASAGDPDLEVTMQPRLLGPTRREVTPGLGSVAPGATVTGRVVCHRLPTAGGRVTARLTGPGVVGDAPATSRDLHELPLVADLALVLLLALLLLLVVLGGRLRRRRRAVATEPADAPAA